MIGTLVKFDAARRALAEARSVDEVKDVRDKAQALYLYVKQRDESHELQNDIAEIKLRAERRLGDLLAETVSAGNPQLLQDETIGRLPDGISAIQSHRWQREAKLPQEDFEKYIAETKDEGGELTSAGLLRLASKRASNLHVSDDTYEWFTPVEYVEAVRRVMGTIDLDPASCAEANEVVKAQTFYTIEDDGLEQAWFGKVFMNPPYNMPHIERFVQTLLEAYDAGAVTQAIVLTNNSTDTGWFHHLLQVSQAVCFTKGRIKYWSSGGEILATRQGQTFFHLAPAGDNGEECMLAFEREFSQFGAILEVVSDHTRR